MTVFGKVYHKFSPFSKISLISLFFLYRIIVPSDASLNRYTAGLKGVDLGPKFQAFLNFNNHGAFCSEANPNKIANNIHNVSYNTNGNGHSKQRCANHRLSAKPIYPTTPLPNSLVPKHIPLDYENLLRSHDPARINFNTRLTDYPGINIRDIDDLYGKIYDRKVLLKQLRYFLEIDDFISIHRLLKYNRNVLNKLDCELLESDFEHLIHVRLGYTYPEKDNLDWNVPFLVGRYVLQHVLQQDLGSRLKYVWLKPKEVPPVPDMDYSRAYSDPSPSEESASDKVDGSSEPSGTSVAKDAPKEEEFSIDYEEPVATPENPIHVHDTLAYRTLLCKLANYDEKSRLCLVRDLYHRLINSKKRRLIKGLKQFQRLKPFRSLQYRRKVANKINIDRVSPFLSRPMRCTDEIVEEYTRHFEEAVEKKDLATACYLLNRYSRRIIFIDKFPLLRKFMDLPAELYASKKYNLQMLEKLRRLFRATVKRNKFLIRYNEPMMIMEAGKTLKDLYEEQLEQYRKRRDAKNDAKMKRMGIDMDEVRDFSNAYGPDWIPILYPEEYEEGLMYHRQRLEKLRKKAEKIRDEALKKKRFEMEGEDMIPYDEEEVEELEERMEGDRMEEEELEEI